MSFWRRLARPRTQAVHALRMTVASLGAFLLAAMFGLPQGFWAVVTALIVTQASVGGSLKAALDRFVGSVCGAVYGGVVAFAIPHDSDPLRALALIAAVAPLSILAAASPGFRVAPITAIIVLLGTAGASLGPLGFAIDRILEVGLGCAVGLLASIVIAPARASHAAVDEAARIAGLLARQLDSLGRPESEAPPDLAAVVASSRKGLSALESLVGEAERERQSRVVGGIDPAPLFRTLLRVRHDVVMLRRVSAGPWHDAVRDQLAGPWADAARAAARRATELGDALAKRRPPVAEDTVADALSTYRAALEDVRRQGLTRPLAADEVGRLFGIGFALDQLRRDLGDLAARASEIAAGQD